MPNRQGDAMIRMTVQLALWSVVAFLVAGCGEIPLGPWGGPAYTLDTEKIGTGQQAISPRNDALYSNGEPMDRRSKR